MSRSEANTLLHLWQRAAFLASEVEGGESSECIRMRLALLHYSFCKGYSKKNTLHLQQIMKGLMSDLSDAGQGSANLVSLSEAITSSDRHKDQADWKCSLSYEGIMQLPEVKLLQEHREEPLSCCSTSNQLSFDGINNKLQNSPSMSFSGTNINPKSAVNPALSSAHSNGSKGTVIDRSSTVTRAPIMSKRSKCTTEPSMKRPRVENETESVCFDRDKQDSDLQRTPIFMTARDKLEINQARNRIAGSNVNSQSYGMSKKSLGTRRGASSRFVPPVKRDLEEDRSSTDSSVSNRLTSKVLKGKDGRNIDSGISLPPELEHNEKLKNIEPRMIELILSEIMDHGAPVQWDDIAGLHFAKATIKEIVVWPMIRPDIFKGLRGPPKGILLFGPPGTGKTLIGKCIASQVNATFFSISASSLTSKWVGEGEKMVRTLFAVARCYQPAVIFIDEIDSLLSQRSDSEHESSRRIKTEFLVQLDGATCSDDDRLLVIGATNRPQEIDEAARRRLVKRLYIPLPDSDARKQIVVNLMRQQPYSLTEEEMDMIVAETEGYSGADMAILCREAAYGPVRESAEIIEHIGADEMRPVHQKDFVSALSVVRPSVSEKDLGLYVAWNKQYGCGTKQ